MLWAMRLRIFTEPQQGATYDTQLAMALAAERLGFDAFFRSDHYIAFGGGDGLPGPTDSWVTLAGLARETRRIRLGTLVSSATFRLPGPLAIAVAQVDSMSGGRIELGLGTGWNEQEHKAYGIAFPQLGERFERLEEQLEIVTGLWRTPAGERFSFSGRHYRLADSPALPKPERAAGPPIIVGGTGPKRTPRLAARFADEFNVSFRPLAEAVQLFAAARAACEVIGRDPATLGLSAAVTTICGRNDNEVTRRAAAAGQQVDSLKDRGACGSPGEVVERLGQWAAAGAGAVYLQLLDLADLDQVELLGAEVLAQLR
jgi:F420-dependent oxidoreductase-like protein